MRTQGAIGALLFGVLTAASGAGFRSTAHACSGPILTCSPPVRLFPVNEVPGNFIYFKTLVDAPGELSLRDADGRVIEADVRMIGGDRVFAPRTPVAQGQTLTLTYTTFCPGNATPALSPSRQTYTFKTYDDPGLEGFAPTITLNEIGRRRPGTPNEERFVRLGYDSPAGSARRHLETFSVLVDGKFYSPSGGPPWAGETSLWRSDLELRSRCGQDKDSIDSCGAINSFAAGKHEVEIWSTIVGAGEQPRAKLTVELSCDSAPSPVADAGAPCLADAGETKATPTAQETNSGAAQASDVDLDVTDQRAPTARGTRGDDAPAVGDELSTDDDATRAHRTSQGCTLANDASGAGALLGLGGMLALLARRHRRAH